MVDARRKVLFISAPVGAGHVRAARATGAALERLVPDIKAEFANVFDFFSPWLGRSILGVYLKILEVFPQAYGMAYGWGNSSRLALAGRAIVSRYLAGRMERYIAALAPAAVVVTHATPAGLVAHLAASGRLRLPTAAVVTDYVVHRLWVYPELDRYFVASEALRDYLADHGVDRQRSQALGIPLNEGFAAPTPKASMAQTLGLTAGRPTVLIMGGGAGVLPMGEIVDALDRLGLPLQIIAVAGKNAGLERQLAAQAARLRHAALRTLGFVDNVHELMAAADLLISKPGGLTAAEALASCLPMVIYRPIPGQEEANTRFLTESGAAVKVGSIAELTARTAELLADSEGRLAQMAAAAKSLGRPRAAEDVAREILNMLGKSALD
jgi:processive 1,2-diacylglycerol beta-glucosyltransferase